MISAFDIPHLREIGFSPPGQLSGTLSNAWAPSSPGAYVVVLELPEPEFLSRSVGGRFKGLDPTVPAENLRAKWVAGTSTMYIGRAKDLRARLELLRRYAAGQPVGHRGGRYLWQLARHEDLRVMWRIDADPVTAECELIDQFELAFGALPFANLVRGARPVAIA